jgi:hypothetical protein
MATTITRLTNVGDYYTSAYYDEVNGPVVSNGLVLQLDAGISSSYNQSNTSTWLDLSNNQNNLRLVNNFAAYDTAGEAINFNNTAYATTSSNLLNGLVSSSTEFSVSLWFRYNNTASYTAIFEKQAGVGGGIPRMDIGYGANVFYWTGWYQPTGVVHDLALTTPITAGTWYHTVLTCTGSTKTVYINGVSVGSAAVATSWPDATQPLGVGGYNRKMDGRVAAAQIYNRALTLTEVQQLYNATAPRFGYAKLAVNPVAASRITTASVALNQLDELASTENTASVVTNGLQLNLDASIGYPGTGNKWFDVSGNNSTATLFSNAGGYPNTAGLSYDARYKGSIYFPATTSSYIQFYAPNMGNTATVEMWANLGPNYSAGMMMGWNGYDVWCSGGAIGFNTNNSDQYGITSTQAQNLNLVGNWKQYVFVMNSATSLTLTNAIYINGVNQALSAINANPEAPGARNFNGGNGAIGSYLSNGGTGFNENMYNAVFRVYNRQLSQTEITQNYNAIAPRFKLPTVGIPVVGLKESATAVIPAGVFDEVSGIVNSNGLAINLDATNYNSYNGTGTVWHNLASLGVDTAMVTAGGGIPWSNTYTGAFLINGTTSTGYFPVYAASQGSLGSTATVELWANIQAFSGGMLFGWQGYNIWTNSGAMGYNTFASDQYGISSAQVTSLGLLNNWKHYVFVMNTSSYLTNQIWVNGVSQTLSQISGTLNAGSCNFNPPYIQIPGSYSSINYLMPLNLGLFRVYNRGLTPAEIVDNFNSKRATYGV